jgi:hypothetical protein
MFRPDGLRSNLSLIALFAVLQVIFRSHMDTLLLKKKETIPVYIYASREDAFGSVQS